MVCQLYDISVKPEWYGSYLVVWYSMFSLSRCWCWQGYKIWTPSLLSRSGVGVVFARSSLWQFLTNASFVPFVSEFLYLACPVPLMPQDLGMLYYQCVFSLQHAAFLLFHASLKNNIQLQHPRWLLGGWNRVRCLRPHNRYLHGGCDLDRRLPSTPFNSVLPSLGIKPRDGFYAAQLFSLLTRSLFLYSARCKAAALTRTHVCM